jgi:hypothetical protein
LLSIINDCYDELNSENLKFDVPFSPTWVFPNIAQYSEIELLRSFPKKKRYKINKILKNRDNYIFQDIEISNLKNELDLILTKHIQYFNSRGLISGWHGLEKLFFKIASHFLKKEHVLFKKVLQDGKLVGAFMLVYSKTELIYFFGGSFKAENSNLSTIIYSEVLRESKKIANIYNVDLLDGMRGGFGYKQKFGFLPKQLFALVNDESWILNKNESFDSFRVRCGKK